MNTDYLTEETVVTPIEEQMENDGENVELENPEEDDDEEYNDEDDDTEEEDDTEWDDDEEEGDLSF